MARAEQAAAKVAIEADPTLPDPPPAVVACLKAGHAARSRHKARTGKQPTADELVLGEVMTAEQRAKCGATLLEWYKSIQKANQTVATR